MRLLKGIALLLIVLALAFAGFFAWASSGTLAEDELAALTVYDDGGGRRAAPHDQQEGDAFEQTHRQPQRIKIKVLTMLAFSFELLS